MGRRQKKFNMKAATIILSSLLGICLCAPQTNTYLESRATFSQAGTLNPSGSGFPEEFLRTGDLFSLSHEDVFKQLENEAFQFQNDIQDQFFVHDTINLQPPSGSAGLGTVFATSLPSENHNNFDATDSHNFHHQDNSHNQRNNNGQNNNNFNFQRPQTRGEVNGGNNGLNFNGVNGINSAKGSNSQGGGVSSTAQSSLDKFNDIYNTQSRNKQKQPTQRVPTRPRLDQAGPNRQRTTRPTSAPPPATTTTNQPRLPKIFSNNPRVDPFTDSPPQKTTVRPATTLRPFTRTSTKRPSFKIKIRYTPKKNNTNNNNTRQSRFDGGKKEEQKPRQKSAKFPVKDMLDSTRNGSNSVNKSAEDAPETFNYFQAVPSEK